MADETPTPTTQLDQPAEAEPDATQQDSHAEDNGPDAGGSQDGQPSADEPDDASPEPDDKTDREAAKYRRQLRAAEAERDALRATVEGLNRAEVERLAASRLIDGSDIWASGVALDSMLNDAGQVDPSKVERVVADLALSRPHWARSAAAPARAVTSRGKPGPADDGNITTWSEVFSRAVNGAPSE